MDDECDEHIHAAVIATAGAALATGAVIIEAIRVMQYIPREPQINRDSERESYINSILCRTEEDCISQIRMSTTTFSALCEILTRKNLLSPTLNMSIKEQLLIFLHVIGHNVRLRVIRGRFYRSTETVHRYFKIVLKAILKLYKDFIKSPRDSTPPEVWDNRRLCPYFQVSTYA